MSSLQKVLIHFKKNKCSKNIYLNSVTLLVGFEALGRHCFCLLKHWRIEIQC